MKKFFIITGEVSGDKHGAHLVKALKQNLGEESEFMGIGGDELAAQGVILTEHIRNISFLGLWEVIKNLSTVKKLLSATKKNILEFKPNAVILVDYPGFNLKIAEFAKKHGIKVIYYICPQIWAWGLNRVYKLKKWVDLFLVILPFEEEFYHNYGIQAHFVGHPSLESAKSVFNQSDFYNQFHINPNSLKIGIMPGSRQMEIKSLLPVMLQAAQKIQKNQNLAFLISKTSHHPEDLYNAILEKYPISNFYLIDALPYDIMQYSDFLWVASGTASLEAGLFGKPSIVLYKVNPLTYLIGKRLVKVPYISLTNLILKKEVFPELIQNECTPLNLVKRFEALQSDENQLRYVKNELKKLRNLLNVGIASENASNKIIQFLNI